MPVKRWTSSRFYRRNNAIGRDRPAPSIGSPTIVWELGIWGEESYASTMGREQSLQALIKKPMHAYRTEYERSREGFFGEISRLVRHLQSAGIEQGATIQSIDLEPIDLEVPRDAVEVQTGSHEKKPNASEAQTGPHKRERHGSIGFTLWWHDEAGLGGVRNRQVEEIPESSIRVFVQVQTFNDHVTLTFYIDAAKTYERQILSTKHSYDGVRRRRVFENIDRIRDSSVDAINSGYIEEPLTADSIRRGAADGLCDVSDYVFDGIWKEFCSAFEIGEPISAVDGDAEYRKGAVYCSKRGLLMSVNGLWTPADDRRKTAVEQLRVANKLGTSNDDEPRQATKLSSEPDFLASSAVLGPVDKFDHNAGEPETVMKSMWPFLRSAFPGAMTTEWVGNGILDWRALYLSTLAAEPRRFDGLESEEAANHASEDFFHTRFILLTKGEPSRDQIGRFLERYLSLEAKRLFTFRNIGTFQQANTELTLINRKLGDVLKYWSERRGDLREIHDDQEKTGRIRLLNLIPRIGEMLRQRREENHFRQLGKLNQSIEKELIEVKKRIDRVGIGGSGHLSYALDRARQFATEFQRLVPTLEVGNVHGWANYEQFVERSIRAEFEDIELTRQKLADAKDGLDSLTQVVQASALIVESDATARNTAALRRIVHALYAAIVAGVAYFVFERWDRLSAIMLKTLNLLESGIN